MKIGMVTVVYKPVVNGVTNMVSLYKRHLEQLGHEVTVFTLGDPDPDGDEPGVIRSKALPLSDYGYHIGVGYTRRAQERLQEMDVLHCHHLVAGVDIAHRYARCPIVLTNHTRLDLYTGSFIPLPQQAADAMMRQIWPEYTDMAEVVITPSESVRQVLLDFGVRKPIEVIPNGVDLEPFMKPPQPRSKNDLGIPESAVLMIYVGRLVDEKNVVVLLEQFAIAAEILPDLHICLVGTGPGEDDIKQVAESFSCADRIHFTGAVPYLKIPNILAAADFFVTASVTEVHPLTVIESMAAGLPVAATQSPGVIDTVTNNVSGFLAADPEQGLAAAMVGLAASSELRMKMGEAARIASQRYDIRFTVANTVELYERLCKTRPDLQRTRPHGRWYRNRRGLRPKLDQLASLLHPDGGYRRFLGLESNQGEEENFSHE
jgi:glycosyltransferase involved in cell wall biosynthesis